MAEVIGPDTPKDRPSQAVKPEDPVANKVWERLQSARGARKSYDTNWQTWERYYLGHHFNKPRAPWKGKYPKNFIFSTIESSLPLMTDQRPQVTVVPTEPNDTPVAEIIGNIVKRVWVDQDMDLKLPDILKNALVYGNGFCKVWWNPALKNGLGDVAISVVDPYHLYPSPGAMSIEDAEYVCFAANVPLSRVLALYPEAQGFVDNGQLITGPWDSSLTVKRPTTSDDAGSFNITNTVITYQGSTSNFMKIPRVGSASEKSDIVTLVEMWDRDENGLAQVTVVCNGVTLRDAFRPFKHTKFPFVRFVDYPIPGEFWGMGEVQQLRPIQDLINERANQIHDILNLVANPQFIADVNSGINTKALVNRPGIVLWKQQGTEARWNVPPAFPAGLFEAQQFDKQDYDTVSGVQDVTQGKRTPGVEAAAAILTLQEAAQTRIRAKTRHMEAAIREIGRQIVYLIQQFYTQERAIRIVGQSAQAQFVRVNVPVPDGKGGVAKLNDLSAGEYDIEIGVGTTLPVSKTQKFEQNLQLFQMGAIDQQELLASTDRSPDQVQAIVTRMQQQQMALMQAQQGAPAAPAPEQAPSQLPSDDEILAVEQEP